jgi:predicted ABC-type ATPase
LLFLFLDSVDLAIERVKTRVNEGGHDIPEKVIKRRYFSGLKNLFDLYMPICDYWMITNNSNPSLELIAEGNDSNINRIENSPKFELMKKMANGNE